MKKVIFIFLILISCLCLAVVSCADKEESSTSSSSNVDGSAEGYVRIGNAQIVWGTFGNSSQNSNSVTFAKGFVSSLNCYNNNFFGHSSTRVQDNFL